MWVICLLLASIQAEVAVVFEFQISGVDPDQFNELDYVIAAFLNVNQSSVEFDEYSIPTLEPTEYSTYGPTDTPTQTPTTSPTDTPSQTPTTSPSDTPTQTPTQAPSESPTKTPTMEFVPVRRRLSTDDIYTLVYTIYVDDQAAADALIAYVQAMDDAETVLAEYIAEILELDTADVTVAEILTYVDENTASPDDTKNLRDIGIGVGVLILIIIVVGLFVFCRRRGYFKHSETPHEELSSDSEGNEKGDAQITMVPTKRKTEK